MNGDPNSAREDVLGALSLGLEENNKIRVAYACSALRRANAKLAAPGDRDVDHVVSPRTPESGAAPTDGGSDIIPIGHSVKAPDDGARSIKCGSTTYSWRVDGGAA